MTDHDHDHDHDRTAGTHGGRDHRFRSPGDRCSASSVSKRGSFTAADHRRFTEFAEHIGPTPAARHGGPSVAGPRVQTTRGLTDAIAASREVGVDWLEPTGFGTPSDFTALHVLEDTPTLHHVIVCALCSCYPRPILGNSPEWYRTPNYRRRIVRWPRQVLAEFGLYLPGERRRSAWRIPTRNTASWGIPVRPEGTEDWDEDQLAEIITRDCLIGVALPKVGVTTNAITDTRPALHPVQH